MRPVHVLAAPLLLALSASAQTRAPEDLGTVTGHVLCGDTQRPARLASVRLVPTSITAAAKPNAFDDQAALGSNLPPVQTDLDGNYTVHKVRPGAYYLRIDYPGYLTPITSFTRDQLAKPSLDIQKRITSELQTVTVAPHAATRADATLPRGAAISGTVTYDDGTPAPGISVILYTRNDKGEFKNEVVPQNFINNTDDHGRYHFDSLPADSFVLAANFSINETVITTLPNPVGNGTLQMNMQKTLFSLPLYSGNVLRLHDATIIKTDAGSDTPAVDLTLPLSKLHGVSGTVTAKDGHTLSGGDVALLYADTREELTDTSIGREDGRFDFPYVPEGSYILTVKKALDINQVEVANPPGSTPKFHLEDKTVHTYGSAEQPLTVQGDLASVLVIVPDKGGSTTP
jgi:hypothetical protein